MLGELGNVILNGVKEPVKLYSKNLQHKKNP